ncbi:sugar ABC transporter substrate-binding protein [Petrotoga sp. 8T1HF07.NaAc.6.1]|uniref:ABC transporter substrate-binding protein n=1 Tax=Petrotoga sp. 8T1HF07.NaAc.6.1 TaxID=1351838 RepID=UPI00192AD51F|nr:sugar ABC transporter substrate-binding protein [Petrotoga sp. 8T1HF07.NaAc.6.1]MBL5980832.1 sugar ABC transporter substrate-binding protein [Petrotoga sp. 8T1HF07.NaAc.6.1]
MKKVYLWFVVFAIVLIGVNVFSVTTIKFMNFSSSGGNEKYLEEWKKIFEKQNPDIKVEIETVGYGDYFTKLATVIAGGNAPDVYELNYENFTTYSSKGILYNLDPLINNAKVNTSIINSNALEAFQSNGVQYGFPYSFSTVVLIYNKDLFDRAGVSYPTDSWKWEDVLNAAQKIRDLDPMIFGIYQPITFNELYKMVQQNNGSFLNQDGTRFTFNTPENIETLQYMVDRVLKYNVMPTDAQLAGIGDWDLFMSGRLGMIITGSWAFPTFKENVDFDWDITVEPGNKKKATHFFSNGLVISKDTNNPEAAFKWLSFLSTSKEVAESRVKVNWELPVALYPDIIELYKSDFPPKNKDAVFDSLNYLVTPPKLEEFQKIADIVDKHLEAARYGVKSPKQALDDAQAELERTITLKK